MYYSDQIIHSKHLISELEAKTYNYEALKALQLKLISELKDYINFATKAPFIIGSLLFITIMFIILCFVINLMFAWIILITVIGILERMDNAKKYTARYSLISNISAFLLGDPTYKVNGLSLDDNEQCYYVGDGYNTKETSNIVGYRSSSSGISFPSGLKGIRFRIGNSYKIPIRKTYINKFDHGKLYITNKRIIYTGNKKSFDIKRELISLIEHDNNTLLILKRNNKNSYTVQMDNIEHIKSQITLVKLEYIKSEGICS